MQENILRLLIRFLSLLPLPVLRGGGRLVGWLLYRLPNRECRTARINLKLCFPDLSQGERELLLKETLKENATTLLEMPAVWYGSTERWMDRMEGESVRQEILQLKGQGKGVIFAMPHLGNFELSAHFIGQIGTGVGLYRPPRKAGLESVMLEGRNRPGKNNRMVPADRHGIKALYQALENNEFVVILPDQQLKGARGGSGVFAPFFGIPALTMTLVNRFASKTGAPVYLIGFVRTGRKPGYQVIGKLAEPEVGSRDLELAAAALNQGIEQLVRLYPAQYQWTYRRFEAQPDGGASPYKQA